MCSFDGFDGFYLLMQVMSMVPETHLAGGSFDDAPVPVEDREFLING